MDKYFYSYYGGSVSVPFDDESPKLQEDLLL